MEQLKILIRYHVPGIVIEKITQGDWIDLRAAEEVALRAGEQKLISLGVSMKLPAGYEAHVAARSSTFKHFGIMAANGLGIIDESYCGNTDIWFFSAYAARDTVIHFGDRICQFRILPKMPPVSLEQVSSLPDPDRGGYGSTGYV